MVPSHTLTEPAPSFAKNKNMKTISISWKEYLSLLNKRPVKLKNADIILTLDDKARNWVNRERKKNKKD